MLVSAQRQIEHDSAGAQSMCPSTGVLCAGRVPVEPILHNRRCLRHRGESSLGSAGLLQWSQTQVYASNIY